jgi:4-hydroxy-tetrahydrodipicolinate synthase
MLDRRSFLQSGLVVLGAGGMAEASPVSGKPLRGIFPIAQTPFTEDDKLDLDSLAEEVRFVHRGKVHGFVWPQLASEWDTLTERERLDGAELVASTGAKLSPAIVLGVQGPDTAAAVRYAKHAEKVGADGLISLPPGWTKDPAAIFDYYKQVGDATRLPLFVQAVGEMGVELILKMYRAIPTLRYVKDEAGSPLLRIAALNAGSRGELKVFTGGHGKTLIDEMMRGFSGTMPAASFADLYASAWNLWHAGREREAVDVFGDAAILVNEISVYPEGMKFILRERGVFQTYRLRSKQTGIDENGKRALRRLLGLVRPRLTA